MWLLNLYPRTWRDRYGAEMAELLRERRWSPGLVADLVAGAVDARLHPQLQCPTAPNESPEAKERATMMTRTSPWYCSRNTPRLTAREQWPVIALSLAGVLVLTAAWMWAAAIWREPPVRDYVMAFTQIPCFAGIVLTMPLRSLRGRPRSTQAIVMGGTFVLLAAWSLLVGFISSKI